MQKKQTIYKVNPGYTAVINSRDGVKLTQCGNITEIMHSETRSKGNNIIKIDKDRYCYKSTGEVMEYEHNESRADDKRSVARSIKIGRDMINANVIDVKKCRWITLTYRENMTDSKRLYEDFKYFNKKCKQKYGKYKYIYAAEPQGRGAWHIHLILIFDDNAPYMANSEISNLWGQGFVKVKKLENVDNVGAYLTAYLGDIELTEYVTTSNTPKFKSSDIKKIEVLNDDGKIETKRFVKGARLSMYPPGFHMFRWSRDCEKPKVEYMLYADARKKVSSDKLTFSKSSMLINSQSTFINVITYEYYNKISKK